MNTNNKNSMNFGAVAPGSPHGKKVQLAVLKTVVDGHAQSIKDMGKILSLMVKEGRLNTSTPAPNAEINPAVTPDPVTPDPVTPRNRNAFNTPAAPNKSNAFNTPPPSERARRVKRTRLLF